MVAHALTYWPNVGPFGPSLPQPPNLTSLRKLQYTSARTNEFSSGPTELVVPGPTGLVVPGPTELA